MDARHYPFEIKQQEIENHFKGAIDLAEDILRLCDQVQTEGHSLKYKAELEDGTKHLMRMLTNDQSFYETEYFQQLAEKAIEDYKSGRTEEWP